MVTASDKHMGSHGGSNRRPLRGPWEVSQEVTFKLRSEGCKELGEVQAVGAPEHIGLWWKGHSVGGCHSGSRGGQRSVSVLETTRPLDG